MSRKFGFYSYHKEKGIIPLDKNNQPLFKTKKAYREFIDKELLPEMGLYNIKEKWLCRYDKPDYLEGTYGPIFIGYKEGHRVAELNSNVMNTTLEHYVYLDIDFTKVSFNEILKDFRVKKNSKAFAINYREYYGKTCNRKIIAIPVKEYYNFMSFKNEYIPKYKGAVKYLHKLPSIVGFNVEIRTLPDNRLLQLHELLDYVKSRKEIDVYKCIKVNQSNFKREYKPKDNWLESDNYNIKYKKEWLIKGKTSVKEVNDKSLKIFPCVINQFEDELIRGKYGLSEMDDVIKERTRKSIIKWFAQFICKEADLTKEDKDKLSKSLYKTFDYCLTHRKELVVNQKFISNQHLLTSIEKINIKTFIIPKAIELLKDTYKRQDYQKQFEFMIEQLAYEAISQIKYDELNQNKVVKTNLDLTEHIKHSVISDKWFNKFIANLRDNYKWFNIKPNYNIKYKLLKALNLDIDEEYIKHIHCKTIKTSIKNLFSVIRDNIKMFPYILSNIDNIINIYFKISNWCFNLANQIDEFLDDYEKKLAPPEKEKSDFWSQFGIKIPPIEKQIDENEKKLINLGLMD